MNRVLVIGGSGLLGRALQRQLPSEFPPPAFPNRSEFDLQAPETWEGFVDAERFDHVVLTAAWTAVDDCESDPARAHLINGVLPGRLARLCAERGLTLTFVSTDYVFSGDQSRPYHESDPAAPLSVYGASKWAGEAEILESGVRCRIVRSGGLYGAGGPDFVMAIAERLESGQTVHVVEDQVLTPTWVDALAAEIWHLTASDTFGTFHIASGGEVSWLDFARHIAKTLGCSARQVEPTTSEAFGRPAPRPAYSVLSSQKYEHYFGRTLGNWSVLLDSRLDEMRGGPR